MYLLGIELWLLSIQPLKSHLPVVSHWYTKRRTSTSSSSIFCLTQIVHFLLLSPACTLKNGSCETGASLCAFSLSDPFFPSIFPSFFLSLSPTITRGLSNHFSILTAFSQRWTPEVFGLLPGSGREHRASAHCGGLATLPHVTGERGNGGTVEIWQDFMALLLIFDISKLWHLKLNVT